jgi:dTDP-4-dehydrorhamnose reductase
MSKILVLGAGGMLGHKLCQKLSNHEVIGTVRKSDQFYRRYESVYDNVSLIGQIDALDNCLLKETIKDVRPDVVINCIGIIKQIREANDPIVSLKINSLLPHELANFCGEVNARFIHISTDCVFAGTKGYYTEADPSDATDIYGRSKFLGEVNRQGCLTLRTSIIGRELNTASGLIEWFLSNRGNKVKGFRKAIYTGFTTISLADIINAIIINHSDLSGVYQVSSDPIDKYTLLCLVRDAFGVDIEIEADETVRIDRSLDSTKFRSLTGLNLPGWECMIEEMSEDVTPYDSWHVSGQ